MAARRTGHRAGHPEGGHCRLRAGRIGCGQRRWGAVASRDEPAEETGARGDDDGVDRSRPGTTTGTGRDRPPGSTGGAGASTRPDLPLPGYARHGDAGADLVARSGVTLARGGGRALVPTGVALAIPEGSPGSSSRGAGWRSGTG